VRILDFRPSLQIAAQSSRDCGEATGDVSSKYSAPKSDNAVALKQISVHEDQCQSRHQSAQGGRQVVGNVHLDLGFYFRCVSVQPSNDFWRPLAPGLSVSKKALENCSPSRKVLSMNLKFPILDTKFWLGWKGLGVRSAGAPSEEAVVAGMISLHHLGLSSDALAGGRRTLPAKKWGKRR
jgi:hypothetical protein